MHKINILLLFYLDLLKYCEIQSAIRAAKNKNIMIQKLKQLNKAWKPNLSEIKCYHLFQLIIFSKFTVIVVI